jgi:hypothetical protein
LASQDGDAGMSWIPNVVADHGYDRSAAVFGRERRDIMKRYVYPFILVALFLLVTVCFVNEARNIGWVSMAAVGAE